MHLEQGRNRPRSLRLVAAIGCVVAMATLGAACATPTVPAPPGEKFQLNVTKFHNIHQNEFTAFINELDEPYILQVGFTVKLGVPNSTKTFLVEDYPREICSSGDGIPQPGALHRDHPGPTTCNVPAAQGRVSFPPVQRLDVQDVLFGSTPLTIAGAVTVAMEEDQLIPIGIGAQLAAIEGALKDILNSTVATASIPSTQAELKALVLSLVGDTLRFFGGRALSLLGGFLNGDDRIGIAPILLVGAKGLLADLLRPALGAGSVASEVAGTSIRTRTAILEPSTFSMDFHAEPGFLENLTQDVTDYRYDYSITVPGGIGGGIGSGGGIGGGIGG